MERKIGETFEYEGEKLKVVNARTACDGCYFKEKHCDNRNYDITGICGRVRKDRQPVIFIKATEEQQAEQPQKETETIKERKIGEVFEYEGKKLKVMETEGSTCYNCYFKERDCDCDTRKVLGECIRETRTDNKPVIFVEVKEETKEQQQEEQKLNLCEILKDCPNGTKLYSPIFGEVDFEKIRSDNENAIVITKGVIDASFTKEGFYYADLSEECLLFPSKEQRDWSKFTTPWLKKERFDPKTLKAFDKIIFKGHGMWFCGLFSHIHNSYACVGETYYKCVIPYNDDTKHLVGTTEEAPEFYKYWED